MSDNLAEILPVATGTGTNLQILAGTAFRDISILMCLQNIDVRKMHT